MKDITTGITTVITVAEVGTIAAITTIIAADRVLTLDSFPLGYRAMVFGATGGIGAALIQAIGADERCGTLYAGARRDWVPTAPKVKGFRFDLDDEPSIEAAVRDAAADGPLHLVLVATGVLHTERMQPEKTWRSLSADALRRSFEINALGPALIAKHVLGKLASGDKAVFAALSARVGSIGDNRLGGWHAYRTSKAALNMLLKTLAIELAVRNRTAICVGLHPGTVDTSLSQPFQANVERQKLFSPASSAEHLLRVIDALTPARSGRVIAWDGSEIPY
jgi:NAD(P)-dependent dehydrogenase (short-subunit alcohol dehydrogenase family)